MTTTTTTEMRPELEPLPEAMRRLPIDERGYPVPWFVAWIDGKPDFRAGDMQKWCDAVTYGKCWVCGGKLGTHMVFVAGPMCGITRTSAEPPSHRQCAEWSVRNCPFLARPHMVRREHEDLKGVTTTAGHMIERNPGVSLLWHTRRYSVFNDGRGGRLIEMGEPDRIEFWAAGKKASRAEAEESIRTGLPLIVEGTGIERNERELKELDQAVKRFAKWLPKE